MAWTVLCVFIGAIAATSSLIAFSDQKRTYFAAQAVMNVTGTYQQGDVGYSYVYFLGGPAAVNRKFAIVREIR